MSLDRYFKILIALLLTLFCFKLSENSLAVAADPGGKWSLISGGIDSYANIVGMVTSPSDWSTVYIFTASNGVYKSIDGGITWSSSSSGLPANGGAHFSNVFTNLLTIDPNNSNSLYLTIGGEVYRTTNGAQSWSKFSSGTTISCAPNGLGTGSNILGVIVDRRDSKHLWAGTLTSGCEGGIFEIPNLDQSNTWQWIAGRPSDGSGMNNDGWDIVQSRANPAILYSSSVHTQVRKSTNGGRSWTSILPSQLSGDIMISLRAHPTDPNILIVWSTERVFKSSNGGVSWSEISGINEAISDIQFAPSNGNILYATAGGKLYKLSNLESSWNRVDRLTSPVPLRSIVIHPADPSKLYISTSGKGVMVSSDGGSTLTARNAGLPKSLNAESLSIDPVDKSSIYAFVSGQGIFKSSDYGRTWVLHSSDYQVSSSFIHAFHPVNRDIVLASGADLYLSSDRGKNWETITPTPNMGRISFAHHPTDPNTIWAGSWSKKKVYKSTDGGSTWTAISQTVFTPESLAISSQNPNTLYSAAFDGLWRSTDGGVTWVNLYTANSATFGDGAAGVRFEVVSVHPTNSQIVYAANRTYNGYISEDGGQTWKVINTGGNTSPGKATFSTESTTQLYIADLNYVYKVTRAGTGYTAAKITNDTFTPPNSLKAKFVGAVQSPSDPQILYTSNGNIYAYTPTATLAQIISNYGKSISSVDQNGDGLINGMDFVVLVP